MKLELDIHHHGQWHRVGDFESSLESEIALGHRGFAHFVYDDDYAFAHLGQRDLRAVSCRYPVDLDVHAARPWPAFMLDILPTGAARRALASLAGVRDDDTADWQLLSLGAAHPPGNLRVVSETAPLPSDDLGFTKEEIVGRDPRFVEYAFKYRIGVAGTSGAQGESPKFLLTEDADGLFHADGVLPDARARQHWLVKWPRDSRDSDRAILRNEAAYMKVARRLGLHVHDEPEFTGDTLFVRRFDRRVGNAVVERSGLESLCSLAGVSAFGARIAQETLVHALCDYSSDAAADLHELVRRDVLNVALGNTDNHARNSSVLKTADGAVRLSPLYDFAPMMLDESGIARLCRWTDCESMGFPDWPKVADLLETFPQAPRRLRTDLRAMAETLETMPDLLRESGTDDSLITRLMTRIEEVRRSLMSIPPRKKASR